MHEPAPTGSFYATRAFALSLQMWLAWSGAVEDMRLIVGVRYQFCEGGGVRTRYNGKKHFQFTIFLSGFVPILTLFLDSVV